MRWSLKSSLTRYGPPLCSFRFPLSKKLETYSLRKLRSFKPRVARSTQHGPEVLVAEQPQARDLTPFRVDDRHTAL